MLVIELSSFHIYRHGTLCTNLITEQHPIWCGYPSFTKGLHAIIRAGLNSKLARMAFRAHDRYREGGWRREVESRLFDLKATPGNS